MKATLRLFAATLALTLGLSHSAAAQTTPSSDRVFAVVSPIAAPACLAAGLATYLIPTSTPATPLDGTPLSLKALLGQSTTPVLIACGLLPNVQGTRCEIVDAAIEVVFPQQLKDIGLASPAPVGSVAESLNRLTDLAGTAPLPVAAAAGCTVPAPAMEPPAGAPPAELPNLDEALTPGGDDQPVPDLGILDGALSAFSDPLEAATAPDGQFGESTAPPRQLAAVNTGVHGDTDGTALALAAIGSAIGLWLFAHRQRKWAGAQA